MTAEDNGAANAPSRNHRPRPRRSGSRPRAIPGRKRRFRPERQKEGAECSFRRKAVALRRKRNAASFFWSRGGLWQDRTPASESHTIPVTPAACSETAPSRHTGGPAECCSVPRLTWFTGSRCVRPVPHHHLQGSDDTVHVLGPGFIPAVADCERQGTANSPTSATLPQAAGLWR